MSYVVIIDAGILYTKVHLFQWDGTQGNPATLRVVKPKDQESYYVSKPGLPALKGVNINQATIAVHLSPIISRLKVDLGVQHDAGRGSESHVHVFFIGSGLRHLDSGKSSQILNHAYAVVESTCAPFSIGTQATNAIVPTDAHMNAFQWAGLIYDHGLPKLTMADLPFSPVSERIGILPKGDQAVLRLEFNHWKDRLPLLSSSPWLTGAAALIIKNQMAFGADLIKEDRLLPVEFILRGTVQVSSNVESVTPSGQAPLFHQISHHRAEEARGREGALGGKVDDDDDLVSIAHMNALNKAAKLVSAKLTELNIKHAIVGGYALALLGSSRKPHDLDLLLDSKSPALADAAKKLAVRQQLGNLSGFEFRPVDKLIYDGKIEVETLFDDQWGVPAVSEATMVAQKDGLPFIAPQYLLMSKFKRWDIYGHSERPKSVEISNKDAQDIDYLLGYLDKVALRGMISYDSYKSNAPAATEVPGKLLKCTANYFLLKPQKERDDLLRPFEDLLTPKDLADFWRYMAEGKPKGASTFKEWYDKYQREDKRPKRRGQ
ncbi:hypothetical protein H0H92_015192 [Tricholoma furcatifolium]|nr:hypothetical protein H0H92_015192 [Tricholoma furcatifolium]